MLTIYCALFQEAEKIIKSFQLKKETHSTHFQVFSDSAKGMRLVITGDGAIASATAVAEISTCYAPKPTDLLLNYGSCVAGNKDLTGDVYVGNKLIEKYSGRTFYPDICYRHPFAEAQIVSSLNIQTMKLDGFDGIQEENTEEIKLYDSEAAAVYQAGNYYYGPHQMIFLKTVSGRESRKEEEAIASVCRYIETLCEICHKREEKAKDTAELRKRVEVEAEQIGESLHCSVVMQAELFQLLLYWKLTDTDYEAIFENYRRQGRLPAKDKREGKKILDELKGKL